MLVSNESPLVMSYVLMNNEAEQHPAEDAKIHMIQQKNDEVNVNISPLKIYTSTYSEKIPTTFESKDENDPIRQLLGDDDISNSIYKRLIN